MASEPGEFYNEHYYRTGCGTPYQRNEAWLALFTYVANHIVSDLQPTTVLDAGCAMGFLVEMLRKQGVEAYGVDISEYAIANVHPDIQPYCWVGSITAPFPQKYDLIVTMEVLEHLPALEAEKAVENLCRHTDTVLFSSGDSDFREVTHFSLRPAETWAALFARQGFYRDTEFDATFVTPWAVCFRRVNEPAHRLVTRYERQMSRLVQENFALRQKNAEQIQDLAGREYEAGVNAQKIAALEQQLQEKAALEQQLRAQIEQHQARALQLQNELHSVVTQLQASQLNVEHIVTSRTYRVASRINRILPPGSARAQFVAWVSRMVARLLPERKESK